MNQYSTERVAHIPTEHLEMIDCGTTHNKMWIRYTDGIATDYLHTYNPRTGTVRYFKLCYEEANR